MSINIISNKWKKIIKKEKELNLKFNDKILNKFQHPWINKMMIDEKKQNPFDYLEKKKLCKINSNSNSKKKIIIYNKNYKNLMEKLIKFKQNSSNDIKKSNLKSNIIKRKMNKTANKNENSYFYNWINEVDKNKDFEIKEKIFSINIKKYLKNSKTKKFINNFKNDIVKYSNLKIHKDYKFNKKFSKNKISWLKKKSTIILDSFKSKFKSFNYSENKNKKFYFKNHLKKYNISDKILNNVSKLIVNYNNNDNFKKIKYLLDYTYNFYLLEENINSIIVFISTLNLNYYLFDLTVNKTNYIINNSLSFLNLGKNTITIENLSELVNLLKLDKDKIFFLITYKKTQNDKKEFLDLRILNLGKPYCLKMKEWFDDISDILFKLFWNNNNKNIKLENLLKIKIKVCINKVRTIKLYIIPIINLFIKKNNLKEYYESLKLCFKRYPKLKNQKKLLKEKKYIKINLKKNKKKKNYIQYNINNKDYIFDLLFELKYKNKLSKKSEKNLNLKELLY